MPRMNPSERKVNLGEWWERVKKSVCASVCVCVCVCVFVCVREREREEGRGQEGRGKKEIRIPRNMRNYRRKFKLVFCHWQLKDASLIQNKLS